LRSRVRLFAWLLLRLKQPQQSTCLVNTKTQFISDGAHWVLRLKRNKKRSSSRLLYFSALFIKVNSASEILFTSTIHVNSVFFYKKTVQWIDCTRIIHVSNNLKKKTSLEWIKFTRTIILILFLIIFYLILLHAQKIMETVVLIKWILYIMEL